MTKLRISDRLSLPVDWMTMATVVYGARGSGKTSLGRVMAEEVAKAQQRFCAIDLKGDWYGLKSSADGKGEGLPVIVFGGDHQDLPLEDGAGAFVGETVADLAQSVIIDLEHFSKGRQIRFLSEFFTRLYDKNREPLLLLLDEAQRYAPQSGGRGVDPEISRCLGAVEDLVKLGRKHGIGPVLFTQRGSGLNKEVSELCDMLVAFRTPGPLDQGRVADWLDANTTKAQRDEVMGQLSGLATGSAVFASGHPDLKLFGVHAVRWPDTFDSSATPKVGQRRAEPKRLAKPDLEGIKEKIAATIERAKASDPKEMQRRLAAANREIEDLKKRTPATVTAPTSGRELARITADAKSEARAQWEPLLKERDATIREMHGKLIRIGKALEKGHAANEEIAATLAKELPKLTAIPGAPAPLPVERPVPPRRVELPVRTRVERPIGPIAEGGLSRAQQKILDTLAMLESVGITAPSKTQLALWCEVSPTSGGYFNNLGALRTAGLIEYPMAAAVGLTDQGRELSATVDPPSAEEMQDALCTKVGASKAAIVRELIRVYPEAVEKSVLAKRLGVSPTSGGYFNNLGALRTLGVLDYPVAGQVVAQPVLFLEGR